MFEVGQLVRGKTNNHYLYTNANSLCIVTKNTSSRHMVVIVLEGDEIKTEKQFVIDMESADGSLKLARFEVIDERFVPITFEEWETYKANHPEITFHRNENYDEILKHINVKEEKSMTTETIAPALSINGNYTFTDEQKDYMFPKFKNICETYRHPVSGEGITTIWEEFKKQKSGLASLLSKHPSWDAKIMSIVLNDTSFTRVKDPEKVDNFIYWCSVQLSNWAKEREYHYHGCTCNELERAKDKWVQIEDKMSDLRNAGRYYTGGYNHVTFEGLTFEEVQRETSRVRELFRTAYNNAEYTDRGYYVSNADYAKYNSCKKFLRLLKDYDSAIANEEFAQKVNEYAAPFDFMKKGKLITFGAVKGQKVSRIANKFLKNYGFDKIVDMQEESWYTEDSDGRMTRHSRMKDYGWNKQYAELSDAINPLEVKRKTIISINPIDFLTMSFGSGWASCHTPDKENERGADGNYSGCYCSGTLSYMLDKCTVIMYTIHDDYDGEDFCLEDKVQRCNFHIGEDKFIQGRLYPDGRSADKETSIAGQFRAIMQKVLSECIEEPNLWTLAKGTDACERVSETVRGATNYTDYKHYDDCNVSFLNRNGIPKNPVKIAIGHKPICPCCGKEHSNEEYLSCYDCREGGRYVRCASCDESVDTYDSDAVQDVDTGEWYCDYDCAESQNVYYCSNVEEYHSENVYFDAYTGEAFYDYWNERIHIDDEHHYLTTENAENDGWVMIDDEWYRTDSEDVITCPHCGAYTLADHEECCICGAIIEDDEEVEELIEAV